MKGWGVLSKTSSTESRDYPKDNTALSLSKHAGWVVFHRNTNPLILLRYLFF